MTAREASADYRDRLSAVAVRVGKCPAISQADTHHRKIIRRNRLHDGGTRFFALLERSTFYQEALRIRASAISIRDGRGERDRLHLWNAGKTLQKPVVKCNTRRSLWAFQSRQIQIQP